MNDPHITKEWLSRIQTCVKSLHKRGFLVDGFSYVSGSRAYIHIMPNYRAAEVLGGQRQSINKKLYTYQATMNDCVIQWVMTGEAS